MLHNPPPTGWKANQTVGTALKLARESKRLSLRAVESATGISNAYLSQLENGKISKPSPFFLHKLATLYDIGYESLMQTAGYLKREDKAPRPKAMLLARMIASDEEAEELMRYLRFTRKKQPRGCDA